MSDSKDRDREDAWEYFASLRKEQIGLERQMCELREKFTAAYEKLESLNSINHERSSHS